MTGRDFVILGGLSTFMATCALTLGLSAAAPQQAATAAGAAAAADRAAVLSTVQAFFDTMASKDVAGAARTVLPEGRFHAMGRPDGQPGVRTFTNEEFLKGLPDRTTRVRERMWNPEVRVHGAVATVWTPYDFWVDGRLSHCGVDAFDLVKTAEGWRIAGGIYTVETGCAPSPLGPLTQ